MTTGSLTVTSTTVSDNSAGFEGGGIGTSAGQVDLARTTVTANTATDFGGGIWDLLAGRGESARRIRERIDASMTPVWEANHVWLVYLLVTMWTGFPPAFAAVMTALFVPLSASLLGIVLRGVGFAFRHEVQRFRSRQAAGAVFASASLMTPFFLGTVVGAIVSGHIPAHPRGEVLAAWTSPTALLTGGLFVAACAYVSAVYLIGDALRADDGELVAAFRRRATLAGVLTGLLAAATFAVLSQSAPRVFDNLTGRAAPLVAVSIAAGVAVLVGIHLGRFRGLRVLAGLAVAAVVWGWGWSQYPDVLPGAYSMKGAAAPVATQLAELAFLGIAILTVGPAFALLYRLQQRDVLGESHASATALRSAIEDQAER